MSCSPALHIFCLALCCHTAIIVSFSDIYYFSLKSADDWRLRYLTTLERFSAMLFID